MNLRKQLSSYIALNNYVEAIRSGQLPAGYTELEYIESTGTQYIDTGVKASDCYGIYADFTPLGIHGLSGVFGSNTKAQNGTSLWLHNGGSGVAFYIRPNTLVALSPQISTNNILNTRCVFSMLNGVATFTYNNVTSSGTCNIGTTTYDTTIKVCGCSAFYDNYSAKAKYNKFMLYKENNTLIRNFIPAMRNSDNVVGMYDTISGTFFTNSGTGDFVAGPEVYKSSIVLTDAITNGLTDLQLKGSEVKNKPETFLDSVVAKGGTEQRNLPVEYTQVNYVTNTVITAVNTGVMIDFAKNYEFEVECSAVSGSWYILQSREIAGAPITGISGSTTGNTISLVVGGISPCTSTITRTVGNKLYVKATLNNGVATLYVKDETAGTEDTKTGSYDTSQTNPTTAMYLLGNAAGQYASVNSDVYMARIKENDTVVMDYIPAKQGTTAGFYDKASGTFKTALTPENLSAGPDVVPTPDTPMDIVCNNGVLKAGPNNDVIVEGTPETVTITGKNLLDINKTSGAGYLDTSGGLVPFDNYYCSDYIEIKPSTIYTYTETLKSEDKGNYIRFCFYDSNKTFIPPRQGDTPTTEAKTYTYKITSPVNAKYIRISSHSDFVKGQLEEGIRPTKYEEYYQASFAPEALLKLSDYQDVQSVLDGVVTKNVGIKVLDGTESWTRYGTGKFATPLSGSKKQDSQEAPISTHFVGTSHNNVPVKDGYVSVFNSSIAPTSGALGINYQATPELTQFKQWLADQYAAGTPVIVVYPLADTVEETVESRDVFITSGTNTIERNSEYVSSDGITVKYKKLR